MIYQIQPKQYKQFKHIYNEQWDWVSNKCLPTKKSTESEGFTAEFYRTFNGECFSTIYKIEREGTLPNSFYKDSITLIPKLDKDTHTKENYKPTSLMNIDAKIINKMLATWTEQHIEKITNHN
jgi:hypothetical protein